MAEPTPRSPSSVPQLFITWMDAAEDIQDQVNRWIATSYAPALVKAGFLSAHIYYQERGKQRYCNIFEIPDVTVFDSPEHEAVLAAQAPFRDLLARIERRSYSVYDQQLDPSPGDGFAVALAAPALCVSRFDINGGEDSVAPFTREALDAATGTSWHTRIARQKVRHPRAISTDPPWILITACPSLDAARHAADYHSELLGRDSSRVIMRSTDAALGHQLTCWSTRGWV